MYKTQFALAYALEMYMMYWAGTYAQTEWKYEAYGTVPIPGLGMCFGMPDGPGVVWPELVGVFDFDTGVPGLSC